MDKWAPIAPSKPQFQSASHLSHRFASVLKSSKHDPRPKAPVQFIGKWPEDVLLRIIELLPIPDLPNTARVNRAFARLVRDERGWEWRCNLLEIQPEPTGELHTHLHSALIPYSPILIDFEG